MIVNFKNSILSLSFGLILLMACEKKETPIIEPDPIKIDTTAKVMFINASPNSVGYDVLADDFALTGSKLNYPDASIYFKINQNRPTFKFNVTQTNVTVFSEKKSLDNNLYYSFFLVDSAIKKAHVFFEDDLSDPLPGKAKIRCLHLAPNVSAMDVAVVGGNVVFPNRTYRAIGGFINLNPGAYSLVIRPTGTPNVKYTIPTFTLEEGKIYTLIIKGFDTVFGTQAFSTSLYQNK